MTKSKKKSAAAVPASVTLDLPIPPHLAAALDEHVSNARTLVDMIAGINARLRGGSEPLRATLGETLDQLGRTALALRRDVAKLRG